MLACPLPPDEALRQQALDDMALVDTPAEHYLDALVELARETFGVKTVLISLIDHDRQWFKARIGLDAEQTPRDLSFCGHAILASEPLMVTDASRDPRFHDNPLVTGPPFIRFYAGEPLHASNGQAIGTLCLIDPSRGFWISGKDASSIDCRSWPKDISSYAASPSTPASCARRSTGSSASHCSTPHPIVEPGRLPRAAPA